MRYSLVLIRLPVPPQGVIAVLAIMHVQVVHAVVLAGEPVDIASEMRQAADRLVGVAVCRRHDDPAAAPQPAHTARTSAVWGKAVSDRVVPGGPRSIQKTQYTPNNI